MLNRPRHLLIRVAKLLSCAAFGLPFIPVANAQTMPQQHTTTAAASIALSSLPGRAFLGKRSREVLAAQVMLDRAHFSPGVIDGLSGGNTARAVKAWQRSKNMEPTGLVDAAFLASLGGSGQEPVVMRYTLSEADVSGPFGELPDRMEAMAELDATHYETAAESLAEKFHMAQAFLRELNPDADLTKAGTTITVTAVRGTPIDGSVTRIEVDGAAAALRAYSADGRLLASYPATVGSSDFPSPSGTMEVRAIAPAPAYYFSPEGREGGPDK